MSREVDGKVPGKRRPKPFPGFFRHSDEAERLSHFAMRDVERSLHVGFGCWATARRFPDVPGELVVAEGHHAHAPAHNHRRAIDCGRENVLLAVTFEDGSVEPEAHMFAPDVLARPYGSELEPLAFSEGFDRGVRHDLTVLEGDRGQPLLPEAVELGCALAK